MEKTAPDRPTIPVNLTPEILVPRLGDYLVEKGIITPGDLEIVLQEQNDLRNAGQHVLLGELLVRKELINRDQLDEAVTEQILQLRAALQDTNQQLERRVQERTRELQTALDKLSELSQLKSNFIANISHELRTPLTHIKGYVELLLSGGMGDLTAPQQGAMQVVQRSTERLEQQIEDLIRFSLVSHGEFSIRFAPFNLSGLLDTIISRSEPKAAEKSIFIVKEYGEEMPRARGDEEKLSWALIQLLDNAIKFTKPDGRVTLSLKLDQGFIDVGIMDTGIGIPEERIGEIFEPFHQLDGSATRRYGGTGLGLALVKQIIDAHGSTIHVLSEVGKGTSFRFVLSVAE